MKELNAKKIQYMDAQLMIAAIDRMINSISKDGNRSVKRTERDEKYIYELKVLRVKLAKLRADIWVLVFTEELIEKKVLPLRDGKKLLDKANKALKIALVKYKDRAFFKVV
jgi:hypothetical protein